jgi:predicted ribosome quality control (RQC) complex YloA/Tae2 family protein
MDGLGLSRTRVYNSMLEYTSSDGIIIKIGENAKENTLLTFSSDPIHWWMHASEYPGCHVVVCDESDELPKDTKKDAMMLALHHSKSPGKRVDVTRVGSVMSTRQMGKVILTNSNTCTIKKESSRLEKVLKTRRKISV